VNAAFVNAVIVVAQDDAVLGWEKAILNLSEENTEGDDEDQQDKAGAQHSPNIKSEVCVAKENHEQNDKYDPTPDQGQT